MYGGKVKKTDLVKGLKKLRWWKLREGGRHEVWTNGTLKCPVPRHREINEMTARSILRKAKNNPPSK